MPAQGSSARLAIKKQVDADTVATGDYRLVPVVSYNLPEVEAFLENDLAGTGRDAPRPARGNTTVEGNTTVPVDDDAFGEWLSMMLGAPTTSGVGPDYTHVWKSGLDELVFYSIEHGQADITPTFFQLARGVLVNTMNLSFSSSGYMNAELGMMGFANTRSATSGAGTPTAYSGSRFLQQQNGIKRNGTDIGKVTDATIRFNNGITVDRYVGGQGLPGDLTLGLTQVTGELMLRLQDTQLFDDSENKTVVDLELLLTRSATSSLSIMMNKVEISAQGAPLQGPAGIQARFNFSAFKDAIDPESLVVTMVNEKASY